MQVRATPYIRWIPAVLIMAVIFYSSSQPYHKQDMRPRLHKLLPEKQIAEQFSGVRFQYAGEVVSIQHLGVPGFVEFFIRKGAHLFIYMALGAAVAYALYRIRRKAALFGLSVLFCALYAASDEFHQSLTGDRTPLAIDVGIDTAGAVIGAGLYLLVRIIAANFRIFRSHP